MNQKETTVILKGEYRRSMFVVEKSKWGDGEINYNISVQDFRYDRNCTTLWGRLKSALKILFGKPVYCNDIYIEEPERFIEFVKQLNVLCEEFS
jgi:hypothetical protein